jgi:anti-sigma factor RsiW
MNAFVACADGVAVLLDYLEGALPPADREAAEAHVSGCPRCVAFIESYRRTPAILRAATDAALPGELALALHRFLASRRR